MAAPVAGEEILDETGRTLQAQLLREFVPNVVDTDGIGAGFLRYRPPYNRIAVYDKKADAVQLVVDNILHRQLALYVGYVVAVNFVEHFKEEYDIDEADYSDDPVDPLLREGALWSRNIVDSVPIYCRSIIDGSITFRDRPASWSQMAVASDTDKGRRKTQEDRMICLPTLQLHMPELDETQSAVSLLAILDGHAGSSIAAYAAAHLPYELGRALKHHPGNTEEALREAMQVLDKRIESRCKVEPWTGQGSTAVIAAIDPKFINIRWLGDSPAYIMTTHEVRKLTTAHQPRNEAEAARVASVGGELVYIHGELRVNGVLNITRALGDLAGRPMVSGDSDGLVITREADQYLVLLMCDGISDMYNTTEMFQMVEAFVKENEPEDYHELAEYFVRTAIDGGSSDNCTCVAGFLRPPQDLWDLLKGESDSESSESDTESDSGNPEADVDDDVAAAAVDPSVRPDNAA